MPRAASLARRGWSTAPPGLASCHPGPASRRCWGWRGRSAACCHAGGGAARITTMIIGGPVQAGLGSATYQALAAAAPPASGPAYVRRQPFTAEAAHAVARLQAKAAAPTPPPTCGRPPAPVGHHRLHARHRVAGLPGRPERHLPGAAPRRHLPGQLLRRRRRWVQTWHQGLRADRRPGLLHQAKSVRRPDQGLDPGCGGGLQSAHQRWRRTSNADHRRDVQGGRGRAARGDPGATTQARPLGPPEWRWSSEPAAMLTRSDLVSSTGRRTSLRPPISHSPAWTYSQGMLIGGHGVARPRCGRDPSWCRSPRDVTRAAASITAAPKGPLAGTGAVPPPI